MSPARRRQIVDREHPFLSLERYCALLGVSRSSLYYRPRGCLGRGAVPDRRDRSAVPGGALLRIETDEGLVGTEWDSVEPEAGAAADARHGAAGHLPAAQHQPPVATAPGLSLPVAERQDHAARPGVGRGHHLPAHGPRFHPPGGCHGLAQPVRGGLAAVQHPGSRLLRRGTGGGPWDRVGRRCSTPTRGASSPPAWSSPRSSGSKG